MHRIQVLNQNQPVTKLHGQNLKMAAWCRFCLLYRRFTAMPGWLDKFCIYEKTYIIRIQEKTPKYNRVAKIRAKEPW